MSADDKTDANQLVRWVNNKDSHCDQLSEIFTYYFMAQRVKPVDVASQEYSIYVSQITSLHKMLILSMKAKQNSDVEITKQLKAELEHFSQMYFGEHYESEDKKGDTK